MQRAEYKHCATAGEWFCVGLMDILFQDAFVLFRVFKIEQ